MDEQATVTRKRKGRSPSYPGIDLEDAITRARQLYDEEGRNAAPVETIFKHWGYSPDSGLGFTILAALKKFGLVNDEGSGSRRKARLSDIARHILIDQREDPTGRLHALQAAALMPPIHTELWEKYRDALPSDATLAYELQMERNFTARGAAEFIPQFKTTLAFAQLLDGGKLSGELEDKPGEESESQMSPPTTLQGPPAKPPTTRQTRVIQLPISSTEWAALQAPFPLTEEKWKQMLAVLDAMKPALVGNDKGSESQEQPDETSD